MQQSVVSLLKMSIVNALDAWLGLRKKIVISPHASDHFAHLSLRATYELSNQSLK